MSTTADPATQSPPSTGQQPAGTSPPGKQNVQTLLDFLAKEQPVKEPLADGLLYSRDLTSLTGRRRHGKTTLISNLGLALTLPNQDFMGYQIPEARRVVIFYLEDDAAELQQRFVQMLDGREPPQGLALYTKEDFYRRQIPIDAMAENFQRFVLEVCASFHPDLVVFDNLAHLIGADYNDSKKIHKLITFLYRVQQKCNVAVLIAAHPRKRDMKHGIPSLQDDPEGFFEECMGSSHFINSTGSLWGIDRNEKTGRTCFLGGTQRLTGTQGIACLEKDDSGWLHVVDGFELNFPLAVNTASEVTRPIFCTNPSERVFPRILVQQRQQPQRPSIVRSGANKVIAPYVVAPLRPQS